MKGDSTVFFVDNMANEISNAVVNTPGEKVFSSTQSQPPRSSNRKEEIDLSKLKTGIYFIEVKAGSNVTNASQKPQISVRQKIITANY
jgi:hypothetical protein